MLQWPVRLCACAALCLFSAPSPADGTSQQISVVGPDNKLVATGTVALLGRSTVPSGYVAHFEFHFDNKTGQPFDYYAKIQLLPSGPSHPCVVAFTIPANGLGSATKQCLTSMPFDTFNVDGHYSETRK